MAKKNNSRNERNERFPGYPHYSWTEDIYMNETEESDIDPETNRKKIVEEGFELLNEKDFREDLVGDDLDIPGVELDDEMELIGSEDEENNYFSLGGDSHHNLDEDQGEDRR